MPCFWPKISLGVVHAQLNDEPRVCLRVIWVTDQEKLEAMEVWKQAGGAAAGTYLEITELKLQDRAWPSTLRGQQ